MIEKLPECRSVRVEFQEGWSQTAKKTLLAFAKTIGGDLYLGVTDDGITKGLSKKAVNVISRTVKNFAVQKLSPSLLIWFQRRLFRQAIARTSCECLSNPARIGLMR